MGIIRTGTVTPLDPDSPKGREIAASLTRILDAIKTEMAAEALNARLAGSEAAAEER